MRARLLTALLVGGCTADPIPGEGVPDLAREMAVADAAMSMDVATPIDLAQPIDLARPIDLAAVDLASEFCAGTKVAGTCAQAFFGATQRCFMASGQCRSGMDFGESRYCWASGAQLRYRSGSFQERRWLFKGTLCTSGSRDNNNGYFWKAMESLAFDEVSGDVRCPDMTKVNIGPNFGGCAALRALLTTPSLADCPAGACP